LAENKCNENEWTRSSVSEKKLTDNSERERERERDDVAFRNGTNIVFFAGQCCVLSVKLHLRDGRTDGRTDRQTPGIEFGASVTSGGNNFNEFPDN